MNTTQTTTLTQAKTIPSVATVTTYAKPTLVMQWSVVNGKLVAEWILQSN